MAAVVDPIRSVGAGDQWNDLSARFTAVRDLTERLSAPLSPEDQTVQSMPDTSPTKWHRAHTTWFFETFVLTPHLEGYRPLDPAYAYLFNSYYEQAGARYPRPQRGLVTRPGVAAVGAYRRHVDEAMRRLLAQEPGREVAELVDLGLHHEQQHQELLLMDIKHVLSFNPLRPAYALPPARQSGSIPASSWVSFEGGLVEIGHQGEGFAYDNESPRHRTYVPPFRLAGRPVTCGVWLDFIRDGGYRTPTLWLSDGWAAVKSEAWDAPLYWTRDGEDWSLFTLGGQRDVDPREPVCHVSYYEADAFARWAGARLPTEAEWEVAAASVPIAGNFVGNGAHHPLPAREAPGLQQMFGDVWEWTMSAYAPYPGYRPPPGAVGEYNGKFMINQMVLRGGCCATSEDHVRATYRNFFYPHQRWAFSGVRLATEAA